MFSYTLASLFLAVVLEALRNLSTQTSIMASPELLPTEALQHCRRRSNRSIPATVTSASASTSTYTFTSTSTSTSAAHHHPSQELELTPKHLSLVHEHSSSASGHKHQSSHKQPSKSCSGSKRSSSARPEEGVQLVQPAKKSRSRPSPPPAPLQNVPFEGFYGFRQTRVASQLLVQVGKDEAGGENGTCESAQGGDCGALEVRVFHAPYRRAFFAGA